MRISIVTPSLAAGGAERSVVLLSEGFQRRQHEVSVVTIYSSSDDFLELPDGIHRTALGIAADSRSFIHGCWNNLNRIPALRKAISATRPDIVISNLSQTNVLTKVALAFTGYSVVLIEHGDPARNSGRRVWQMLRRAIYPRASMLVSVSQSINDYFAWLPESKRMVIPNPVGKIDQRSPAGASFAGKDPGEKWIAAMGRLIPAKGFDRLLAAFAKLAQRHPEWQLIIMGEGELRPELGQQIKSLNLNGRVQLKGLVHNPSDLLRNSEFFVMSSRSEGFPYALLEAMSCGLPAVAMDCASGSREIIREDVDGMLVPDGDIDALAAAMDHLMNNASERERLAARAPEVMERFGSDKVIAQWEALLHKLGTRSQ